MGVQQYLIASLLIAGWLSGCDKAGTGTEKPVAPVAVPTISTQPADSSVPASASVAGSAAALSEPVLPAEIITFREKRDLCDHFRGEEVYDAKRAAVLAAEVAKNCRGTDRALADLRQLYANNAKLLAALKDYEDKVE